MLVLLSTHIRSIMLDKCIVTGACGHIGNVLVKQLVKLGYQVKALALPNEDLSPLKDLPIEIVKGDISNREFVFDFIEKNSAVFHLASFIDIGSSISKRMYEVNVLGTQNIVDACLEKGAKKLIYTSSVHVIEPLKGNVVLSEPNVFDENKIVGSYAKTKTMATKYVFEATKNTHLHTVVVYPAGVIGPNDYKISELGQLFLDLINRKLPAYVKGGYNFVDVRDVALGIIQAYRYGKHGEGYILSNEQISIKNVIKIVNERFNRKSYPIKLPLWLVKISARIIEKFYLMQHKKPLITPYSIYTVTSNSNFSCQKAKDELGYSPRPLSISILDSLEWLINNKQTKIRPKILEKIKLLQKNLITKTSTNTVK